MGYIPTMPSLSPRLSALIFCLISPIVRGQVPPPADPLGSAPAPAPVAVAPQPPAERQIDIATVAVRQMDRIAASIDQEVDMLNQKFKLEGNYYKDTGNRMRLQLKLVGLGDAASTMLQVCDGKILWDYQKVLGMQSYKKREIVPILKKLEDPVLDEPFRVMITSSMGFGGPEAMLSGLRKAVLFDQLSEEKLDGVDVYVLGGQWRDRSNLMTANDRPLSPTAPLPPYIPSNVRVFVGKFDGWPYKIEMIGNKPSLLAEDTRQIDPATNRPIGQPRKPPKVDPSKITLRYKLLPITAISPGLFNFDAPADVAATSVKDETEEFLAMLDQYIQVATNNKKAEAAKAEASGEPVVKVPTINVPSAPSPTPGGLGTLPGPETPSPK
jgi:hypothetical protein